MRKSGQDRFKDPESIDWAFSYARSAEEGTTSLKQDAHTQRQDRELKKIDASSSDNWTLLSYELWFDSIHLPPLHFPHRQSWKRERERERERDNWSSRWQVIRLSLRMSISIYRRAVEVVAAVPVPFCARFFVIHLSAFLTFISYHSLSLSLSFSFFLPFYGCVNHLRSLIVSGVDCSPRRGLRQWPTAAPSPIVLFRYRFVCVCVCVCVFKNSWISIHSIAIVRLRYKKKTLEVKLLLEATISTGRKLEGAGLEDSLCMIRVDLFLFNYLKFSFDQLWMPIKSEWFMLLIGMNQSQIRARSRDPIPTIAYTPLFSLNRTNRLK